MALHYYLVLIKFILNPTSSKKSGSMYLLLNYMIPLKTYFDISILAHNQPPFTNWPEFNKKKNQ